MCTGKLSYIISNKLLSNDYAVKLRKFLIENATIQEIIDSSEVEWFSASVYPVIFVIKKTDKAGTKMNIGYIQNDSELKAGQINLIEIPTNQISRLYNSIIPSVRSKKEFDLLLRLSEFSKDLKVFRPKPTSISVVSKDMLSKKPEVIQEKYVPVVSNEDVFEISDLHKR